MIYYKKLQNLIRKEGIPAMKETLARIQQTLDYIEDNLKTEISPQELSALAGFSPAITPICLPKRWGWRRDST